MSGVHFGVEFRTQAPIQSGRHRFLLVRNQEIRFLDPATLKNIPYTSDLNTIAERVNCFAEKAGLMLSLLHNARETIRLAAKANSLSKKRSAERCKAPAMGLLFSFS